jgi:DNA-binding CsgD family transcriptional regulator
MARSRRLRGTDYRSIIKLVGECRDLGDDVVVWRTHFQREMGRLVNAPVACGGEKGGALTGENRNVGELSVGWEHGFNKAGWDNGVQGTDEDPGYSDLHNAYRAKIHPAEWTLVPRREVLPDREFQRGREYEEVVRTMGVGEVTMSFLPIDGGFACSGLVLCRAPNDGDFMARSRHLIVEAHTAIVALVGGPLARFSDPAPSDLAPRVRQVLQYMLEGDGDKQIAVRMGLTRHTINEYAKRIHRYFSVNSRPELLARWVKRGWGAKFAWADDD